MSSTAAADFVDEHEPPIRVIAIRDLLYCERLFYLTEVENIQCPNEFIFAGRRLHGERVPEGDETPELRSFELSSEAWGLKGKVDAVRRRDGAWAAAARRRKRAVTPEPDAEPGQRPGAAPRPRPAEHSE